VARRAQARRLQPPAQAEEAVDDHEEAKDNHRQDDDGQGDERAYDDPGHHDGTAPASDHENDDHDDHYDADDDIRAALTSGLRAGRARTPELPHRGRG